MRTRPILAIDGPAGAGKSTVARRVGEELGFVLVDTGALYRAVALAAKRAGVAFEDATGAGKVAAELAARGAIVLGRPEGPPTTGGGATTRVTLDGEDVSEAIRTPEMSMGASTVSAHPGVRAALLEMQRAAGRDGGVVLEGRDIGTVVFPDAELKFFLTARPEVRAKRRTDELAAKGQIVSFEETLAEVRRRDAQDSGRAVAPLRQADDAELVETSAMTIDEAVAHVVGRARAWRPR
jgi:cytidylate kinase